MSTLAFRTEVQKALWDCEIAGQISDGHWENSSPHDHWKSWCRAEIIVDPSNIGRDFFVYRDAYCLASKQLLDVVGERMLIWARLTLAGYDKVTARAVESSCFEFVKGISERCIECWRDPDLTYNATDADWQKTQKDVLSRLNISRIRAVCEDVEKYGWADLKNDLREMSAAMKKQRKSKS